MAVIREPVWSELGQVQVFRRAINLFGQLPPSLTRPKNFFVLSWFLAIMYFLWPKLIRLTTICGWFSPQLYFVVNWFFIETTIETWQIFIFLSDGALQYPPYLTLVQVEGSDFPQPLATHLLLGMNVEGAQLFFSETRWIQILGNPGKEPFQPLKWN